VTLASNGTTPMSNSAVREAGRRWRDRQKEAFWRVVVSRPRRSGLGVRAFWEGEGLKATREATSVALSFSASVSQGQMAVLLYQYERYGQQSLTIFRFV